MRSLFIIRCQQETKANLNSVAEMKQDFKERWIWNGRIVWHRCSLRAAGVKTNELNVKSRKPNMVRIVPNVRDKFLKITIKKFRLWKKQLYDHRYQQIVISWWSWEDKHCSCRSKTETQRYLCFQFRYVRRFWKSQNSNAPLQFLIITNPWQWWLLFVGFYSSFGDPRFLKL